MATSVGRSPSSTALLPKVCNWRCSSRSPSILLHGVPRSFTGVRMSAGSGSSPIGTDLSNELDVVSSFSEIVPDTVVFDDFERFPPTAATVSSSLLLGICSLPDTKFKSAIETAMAASECFRLDDSSERLSCFFDRALVNVGAELVRSVPGRVSTEVDARLAYDTQGIIHKVNQLLKLYNELDVSPQRLLFKIPSTWQGIEASRLLELEGIQTHLTFVYSFPQAAAAAQAGASVIQIFVGRIRDWARNHSGDREIESSSKNGEDPGLALVEKTYNYIHKYGYKSKLMAAAVRNKQDLFSLLGIDYIIAPLKILESLKESVTDPEESYSYVRRLAPGSARVYNFTEEEQRRENDKSLRSLGRDILLFKHIVGTLFGVTRLTGRSSHLLRDVRDCLVKLVKWDQRSFASAIGPAAEELLAAGLEGYVNQTRRIEELFGKIWPPPNV